MKGSIVQKLERSFKGDPNNPVTLKMLASHCISIGNLEMA
jgi:hypothetical protein